MLKTIEGNVHLKAIFVPEICKPKGRLPFRFRKKEVKDKPFVEPVNEGSKIDMNIREWPSNHSNIMKNMGEQGIAHRRDTHIYFRPTKKPVLTGTLQPTLAISLDKRNSFSQFATFSDTFRWLATATLKAKLFTKIFGKKVGQGAKF